MQPADATTLRLRGNARFQAKDFDGAVQAFSLLLSMHPAAVPGAGGPWGKVGHMTRKHGKAEGCLPLRAKRWEGPLGQVCSSEPQCDKQEQCVSNWGAVGRHSYNHSYKLRLCACP